MKKTLVSLAVITLTLTACKKEVDVKPEKSQAKLKMTAETEQDTIPDKAVFKIRLAKDSSNRDETMILFDHTADVNYSANSDAIYFQGFGLVSLSSVSGDGKNMSIYTTPYKPGMSIGLNVKTKNDGDYSLELDYKKNMPENLHVWIRDDYLKDSIDVCSGRYNFKVTKADTNSFGSKRFSLVFKQAQ
jgi:hypothetical protein